MSEYAPSDNAYRVSDRSAVTPEEERAWARIVLGTVAEARIARVGDARLHEPPAETARPGYHAERVGNRVRVTRDDVEIGVLYVSPDDIRSDEQLREDALWLAANQDAGWLTAEIEHQHRALDDDTRAWWDGALDSTGVYDALADLAAKRALSDAQGVSDSVLLLARDLARAAIGAQRRDIAESIYCHIIVWAKIEMVRHFPTGAIPWLDQDIMEQIFAGDTDSGRIISDVIRYTLGIWIVDLADIVSAVPEVRDSVRRIEDRRTRAAAQRLTGRTLAPSAPFSAPSLTFLNDPHTHAVIRSMWDMANWRRGERQLPQYRHDGVRVYMTDEGGEGDGHALDAAWQRVLELDDSTASAFLICIGKWFADTGGDNLDLPKTRVHVADILAFRGVKKHAHGGYRVEQKEEARRHILALNHIWVQSEEEVYEARGRKKRVRVDSRLLEVALETEPDSDGQPQPYAFRIAPGEWARSYLGSHNRLTAQLLQPVMAYDPYRQRMALRLGIYLASQWRIRASSRNYEQPWRVRTMLSGASLDLPRRNLQRFRDQFENALDTLQADGVIAAWEYERDSDLPQRQWFDQWLDWTVRVAPPAAIVEHYASIASSRSKAIARARRAGAGSRRD